MDSGLELLLMVFATVGTLGIFCGVVYLFALPWILIMKFFTEIAFPGARKDK